MKTGGLIQILSLLFLVMGRIAVYAQENQSEVPGDHFSLEGALELFKKSGSPEQFEQMLNSSDSKVNNLDLNGDGDIDYLKVIDRNDGNVHAFVMQAVISETETQDVAVIELEKLDNGKAVLQITGDADIYGIETIIEPTDEVRINAGTSITRTIVNVWAWPSVQYIYSPYYSSAWVSSWGWSMRPVWWHTWRPVSYNQYNPWWQPYRPYYSVCYTHRIGYARHIYQPYRTSSIVVYNIHNNQISNYRSSHNTNHYGNDGYSNSTNHRNNRPDTDGRYRSNNGGDSRPSSNTGRLRQTNDDFNRRSSRNRDMSSSNNSSIDNNNMPNLSHQNWNWQSRQDLSKRWSSGAGNNNGLSRQPSTPSYQHRSTQRSSSFQQGNRGSSGNNTLQRSGNGGGNSSGNHRRGR